MNDLRLHCLSWNKDEADLPTIVLFHGWLDHAAAWVDTFSPIAAAGYRVFIPEQRGHGRSEHLPAHSHYHFPDYVADMQTFLQENDLAGDKLILIGHSMGGSIATLLCGVGAVKPKTLVLIEGLGPAHEPPETAFERYQTHLKQRLSPRPHKTIPTLAEAASRINRLSPVLTEERAIEFARYITKPVENGYQWRWDGRHRDKAPIGYDSERYKAIFQSIDTPTSLIWGRSSWYLKLTDLQERVASLANVVSEQTLETGHSPHYERPHELAMALLENIWK